MFGDIVRRHRRRLGFSQQELADRSGVTVRGLRKIESGQIGTPRPVTVRLLAEAFGLAGVDRDRFCAAAHPALGDEWIGPLAADPPPAAAGIPAQLPTDVTGFVGRAGALRQLDALLEGAEGSPTAVIVTAVAGTAGVGKTSLAVHWAHRVRDRFPDGQLYINLRGFDPSGTAMASAEVIRRLLDALRVPPERIPLEPDAQADLYRTVLADKAMLILLDNARHADQVRPLLPGAPGCLVLITSRARLTSLIAAEGAHSLPLDLLSSEEARQLLARRLGASRLTAEPDAVDEIVARCSGLPLALAIVAANAATHPQMSLTTFAAKLRDSRIRLDALSTSDSLVTDIRAVFSWSYEALSQDAAQLFRLLGLHPGPDVSMPAAASLAALPVDRAGSALTELVNAHLIDEPTPGRYACHDLLRAYAADLLRTTDSDQQRHTATGRMLDHYLHSAHTAAMRLMPARDQISLAPPQPGVIVEHPADHEQAYAWLTAERSVLLGAIDKAAATEFDTHTWQLAWSLYDYLDRGGHWHDLAATQHTAVAAGQRLAHPTAQARAHRYIAHAYMQLGRFDDAHSELQCALDLHRQAADVTGQAYAHHIMSSLWGRRDGYREALDHAQQSLELFTQAGDRLWQGCALNGVGWFNAQLGDYEQTITCCEQALALLYEFGDRRGLAATWDSLGFAHHHLGHYDEAIACYNHALQLVQELRDLFFEAVAHSHIGDTHRSAGDPAAARDAWQQALIIFHKLGHSDAEQVGAKLAALGTFAERTELAGN